MTPSYQLNNQHSLIFWPSRQCYDLSNNILYPTAVKKIHPKTLRVFCKRLCGWLGDDESGYLIYTQRLNLILGAGCFDRWPMFSCKVNFSVKSIQCLHIPSLRNKWWCAIIFWYQQLDHHRFIVGIIFSTPCFHFLKLHTHKHIVVYTEVITINHTRTEKEQYCLVFYIPQSAYVCISMPVKKP